MILSGWCIQGCCLEYGVIFPMVSLKTCRDLGLSTAFLSLASKQWNVVGKGVLSLWITLRADKSSFSQWNMKWWILTREQSQKTHTTETFLTSLWSCISAAGSLAFKTLLWSLQGEVCNDSITQSKSTLPVGVTLHLFYFYSLLNHLYLKQRLPEANVWQAAEGRLHSLTQMDALLEGSFCPAGKIVGTSP